MIGLNSFGLALRLGAALALIIAAVGYADTTEATATPTEKLVTLQVANTPVIDALDRLFSQAGYKYTIESGVSGNITLRLKDIKFSDALDSLAEGASLNYRVSGGRYIISPKPKPKLVVVEAPSDAFGLPPGNPDISPEGDLEPIFYGHLTPPYAPFPVIEIPLGPGSLIGLPNGDSVYIIPADRIRTPSALDSPALSSPAWERFKRLAAPLWFRPSQFD